MTPVTVHPAWVWRFDANHVAAHFARHGYDVYIGPRFLRVAPKPPYEEPIWTKTANKPL